MTISYSNSTGIKKQYFELHILKENPSDILKLNYAL